RYVGVALFTAAWANMHASFFLAPVIAVIFAVAQRSVKYLWIAGAAAIGSLANPYGWRLHAHIISYLLDNSLTSRIAEFQSFNFHDKDATQVALTMAFAAAGAVLALTQKKFAYAILTAGLLWSALRSARVIPLVALVALPLANNVFAEILQSSPGRIGTVLRYSAGLFRIDRRLNGAVFCALAAVLMLIALRSPAYSRTIGFSPTRFPVEAAKSVESLPSSARIVSSDLYGGYLIYRFNGARK